MATKSVKHKKHFVVKYFSGAKFEDMKHYVKLRKKNNLCKYTLFYKQHFYKIGKKLSKSLQTP